MMAAGPSSRLLLDEHDEELGGKREERPRRWRRPATACLALLIACGLAGLLASALAPGSHGGNVLPLLGRSSQSRSSSPLKPTSSGKHRELPHNPSYGPPREPVYRPSYHPFKGEQPCNPPSPPSLQPPANASSVCSWQSYRLPTDLLPTAYNLTIELPSLTPPSLVYGTVTIELQRNASAPPPQCVVFHVAPEVQIDALAVALLPRAADGGPADAASDAGSAGSGGGRRALAAVPERNENDGGRPIAATISRYDAEWSQMHVELSEPIRERAVLAVSFSYELRDKLTGLYHSRFTGVDGQEHSIATTQHEATSARETFPCWDEPLFKATFRLQLHVPDTNGTVALSNMPALDTRPLVVPMAAAAPADGKRGAGARYGGADATDAGDAAAGGADAAGTVVLAASAATSADERRGSEAEATVEAEEAEAAEKGQAQAQRDDSLRAGRPLAPEGVEREQLPLKRVVFDVSPKMATYLVAFTVGEFEAIRTTTPSGIRLSAWAPAATRQVAKLRYALKIARDALTLYEKLLGVPFPLPKIDIVSIPDFGPGAMENWGLITYRATSVLADEHSAPGDIQSVACTVVHELGHQWTGNLVTMRWWDELWLNEGFANYFEQAITSIIAPRLMIGKQHVQYLSTALHFDGSPDTHAVRPPRAVASDSAIEALFDSISYDKAGAIIYMLHDYLDRRVPGAFLHGLQSYLLAHQFGSASGSDMWQHLGEASGLPISEWIEPWFSQAGYPLIEVTTLSDGSAVLLQTGRFTQDLTKEQIAFSGHAGADQAERMQTWWVPISYFTSTSDEVHVSEIASSSSFFSIPPARKQKGGFDIDGSDWLKVNYKGAGYYRVNYPPHLWARLVQAATEHLLSDADLANLIDDAFALTLDGRLSGVTLSLARALGIRTAHEPTFVTKSYESWQAMSSGLMLLLSLVMGAAQASSSREGLIAGPGLELIPSRCVQDLQRFVRTQALGRCLDPLLSAPPTGRPPLRGSAVRASTSSSGNENGGGGDGDDEAAETTAAAAVSTAAMRSSSQLEALAKPILLELASSMGDARVGVWASGPLRACLAMPDAHCEAIASIPPELRFACLDICSGFDICGRCWQLMLGQLRYADNDPAYRYALLSALARAPTAVLHNVTLGLVLNSTVVRGQDVGAMVSMLASNPKLPGARLAVWEFVKANAYALTTAAGGAGSFDMGGVLSNVAGGFASEEMAQDIETFLALNPEIGDNVPARIVRAIVGKVRSQAIWLQNYGADSCAVLASFHA